ncbi:hypothetical protein DQD06_08620 [Salmonella enterica subsp. houtenae]|nr:hypothetical protein [Salmonella enterica subsp. houtenae]
MIHRRPSFTFLSTEAIPCSNSFMCEALRYYTDCQSFFLNIILPLLHPAVKIKRVNLNAYVITFNAV